MKILLRPEALRISPEGMPATVLDSVYRGPVHEVRLALPMPGRGPGPGPGQELLIDSTEAVAVGQSVNVAVSDAWIIPGA
ncbi:MULTISPECIES: TOBE domain-containing protein [unclassified Mesorhizobium]|uniref:TOBE domain-containing protein n=1 Tax=unclassified Mesorhizobium TaxID=325217 RepID=UPI001FE05F8A|nr:MULTISPECIES: TOBE domain-containing protein [unclassified Mesorhizobium]